MVASTKWRSTSKKARKGPRAPSWTERLEGLRQLRAPYLECQRVLVERALARISECGRIVEVGAGSGQFRRWLPPASLGRFVHTDTDAPSLERLQKDFVGAETLVARADRLPLDASSASGVVGLCVFDMLDELDSAFREWHRVLEPGGVVVHLLDMMPALTAPFRDIVARGRIPLPNVFADAVDGVSRENLLLVEREAFFALFDALRGHAHPLSHIFGYYFEHFRGDVFDEHRAAADYDTIAQSPASRQLFESALRGGFQIGFRLGLPPPEAVPFSTARHLFERLERAALGAGFRVEVNELWTAWAPGENGAELAYRSLVLGRETRSKALPQTLLCPEAPRSGTPLVEAGMAAFVARRS